MKTLLKCVVGRYFAQRMYGFCTNTRIALYNDGLILEHFVIIVNRKTKNNRKICKFVAKKLIRRGFHSSSLTTLEMPFSAA